MASPEVRIEASQPTQDTAMGDDNNEAADDALEALEEAGEEGNGAADAEESPPQMPFLECVRRILLFIR